MKTTVNPSLLLAQYPAAPLKGRGNKREIIYRTTAAARERVELIEQLHFHHIDRVALTRGGHKTTVVSPEVAAITTEQLRNHLAAIKLDQQERAAAVAREAIKKEEYFDIGDMDVATIKLTVPGGTIIDIATGSDGGVNLKTVQCATGVYCDPALFSGAAKKGIRARVDFELPAGRYELRGDCGSRRGMAVTFTPAETTPDHARSVRVLTFERTIYFVARHGEISIQPLPHDLV